MQKIKDREIIRLQSIQNSILNIYENLSVKNTKKKKYLLDYNEIACEIESKIFEDLGITKENCDQYLNRFSYLLKNRNISEDNKGLIEQRFQNMMLDKFYLNPFKENPNTSYDYNEINIDVIARQAYFDYVNATIYNLQNKIKEEKNYETKKSLYISLKKIVFSNKRKGYVLKNPDEMLVIDGRERCLVFGHNENLINSIYAETTQNILNSSINTVLGINNKQLNGNRKEFYNALLSFELNTFKSALNLLDNNGVSSVCTSIYRNYLNRIDNIDEKDKSSISIEKVKETLSKEVARRIEIDKENKTLKKVN